MIEVVVDELTEEEQEWVNRFAVILAMAYGSARGPHPLPVRSAVFRGSLSLFEEWIGEHYSSDGHDPLYRAGRDRLKLALARQRMFVH